MSEQDTFLPKVTITDQKAGSVATATATKQRIFDPVAAQENSLRELAQNIAGYRSFNSGVATEKSELDARSSTWSKEQADRWDPNSDQNKGKLFTTGSLKYPSGIAQGTGILGSQFFGGAVDMTARTVSGTAKLGTNSLDGVDDAAIPAYQKLTKNEQLKAERATRFSEIDKAVSRGELSREQATFQRAQYDAEIQASELSTEEEAILASSPSRKDYNPSDAFDFTGDNSDTNLSLLRARDESLKSADTLKDGISKLSSWVNTTHGDKFTQEASTRAMAPHKQDLEDGIKLIEDGDTLAGGFKTVKAVLGTSLNFMLEAAKDPWAAAQVVSTEAADIAAAALGPAGQAVSGLESMTLAVESMQSGLSKFIEREGRLPNQTEQYQMLAAAISAGGADLVGDFASAGVLKPLKVLGGTKTGKAVKEVAAKVAPKGTAGKAAVGTVKGVNKVAGKPVAAAATEGLTEAYQTAVEEDLASLAPVRSTEKILQAGAVGALVGGTARPLAGAAGIAKKTGQVSAVIAGNTGTAVKEATVKRDATATAAKSTAAPTKAAEVATLAESDTDISATYLNVKDTKNFKPVLAAQALAARNNKSDATPEEKAVNLSEIATAKAKVQQVLEGVTVKRDALLEKQAAGEKLTKQEKNTLVNTERAITDYTKAVNDLSSAAQAARNQTEADPRVAVASVKAAVESGDTTATNDAVVDLVTSGATTTSLGSELITSIQSNPDVSADTKATLNNLQAYEQQREALNSSREKDPEVVHNDVINGGVDGHVGTEERLKNIGRALRAGNLQRAKQELDQLRRFQGSHTLKRNTLRNMTNAMAAGRSITPQDQAYNEQVLAPARGGIPYRPNPNAQNWLNTLDFLDTEVGALDAAVDTAQSMIQGSEATTTAPITESASPQTEAPPLPEQERAESVGPVPDVPPIGEPVPGETATTSTEVGLNPDPVNETPEIPQTVEAKESTTEGGTGIRESDVEQTVPVDFHESLLDYTVVAPNKETNLVRRFGKVVKRNNALHKVTDFFGTLQGAFANKDLTPLQEMFPEGVAITENTVKVLWNLNSFMGRFIDQSGNTFKQATEKGMRHRYKDPIKYLTTEEGGSELHPKVVQAIALSAYQWLVTRGRDTLYNDDDAIKDILGLNDSDHVSAIQRQQVTRLGTSGNAVAEAIGREAFRALGITFPAGTNAPADLKTRMEMSLGLHAVRILQQTGALVEQNADLELFQQLAKDKLIKGTSIIQPVEVTGKDKSSLSFVRLAPGMDKKGDSLISRLSGNHRAAPHTLDYLLRGKQSDTEFSWDQPGESSEPRRIGRSGQRATPGQEANLRANERTPLVPHAPILNLVNMFSVDQLQNILGYQDEDSVIDERRDGVAGKNLQIDRTIEALTGYFSGMKDRLAAGKSIAVYLPATIGRPLRMTQRGSINRQGNKMHRAIFVPEGQETTFKKTDRATVDRFIEAVGIGFGIEEIKRGGPKQAVKDTREILNQDKMVAAVSAITGLLSSLEGDINLTPEQMDTETAGIIANALDGMDDPGHALSSLIEYARFQASEEDTFSTPITFEMDGTSNGVFLGMAQMSTKLTSSLLAIMRGGGAVFSADDQDRYQAEYAKRPYGYDPYEITGMFWAQELATIMANISSAKIKQHLMLNRVFGEFNGPEGTLNRKAIRKLSKGPSTTTAYGSGNKANIKALADIVEDHFLDRMQEVYAVEDPAEAQRLLNQVIKEMTTIAPGCAVALKNVTASNREALKTFKIPGTFSYAVRELVAEGIGEAANNALQMVYGDVRDSRGAFNTGYAYVAAHYNALFKTLVQRERDRRLKVKKNDPTAFTDMEKTLPLVEAADRNRPDLYLDLPQYVYDKIREELAAVFPTLTTPFGGSMDMTTLSSRDSALTRGMVESRGNLTPDQRKFMRATKKGFIQTGALASNPRVNASVYPTISTEAFIANGLMGQIPHVMNAHDGHVVPMKDMEATNETLNQLTFEMFGNYDMANTMFSDIHKSLQAASDLIARAGIDLDAYNQALREQLGEDFFTRNGFKPGNPVGLAADILTKAQTTAKAATATKKAILSKVTVMNQYSRSGGGYTTGQEAAQTPEGQPVAEAIDQATEKLVDWGQEKLTAAVTLMNNTHKRAVADVRGMLGSEPDSTSAPSDNTTEETISQENALGVFDRLADQGTRRDSAEHVQHLRGILSNIVSTVMRPTQLFITENARKNGGEYNPYNGSINLGIGNERSPDYSALSPQSIYVHELLHSITAAALFKDGRVTRELQKLFDMVAAVVKPEDFLSQPDNPDDQAYAERIHDYIFGTGYTLPFKKGVHGQRLNKEKEVSAHLAEFLAHGLAHPLLVAKLKATPITPEQRKIFDKSSWDSVVGNNWQELLVSFFNRLAELVMGKFSSPRETNAYEQLEALTKQLVDIDTKHKGAVYTALQKSGAAINAAGDVINPYIKQGVRKLLDAEVTIGGRKHGRYLSAVEESARAIDDPDNTWGSYLRGLRRQADGKFGFFRSLLREMRGDTDRLGKIYNLLNLRNGTIERVKLLHSEVMAADLDKLWEEPLVDHEKQSLFRALKTDLQSLGGTMSVDAIAEVLGSSNARKAAIQQVHRAIASDRAFGQYYNHYTKQARSLGYFLVHGRALEETTFLNVRAIAALDNTGTKPEMSPEDLNRAVALIDKLATLYALEYTTPGELATLHNLATTQENAFGQLLGIHRDLVKESTKRLFPKNSRKQMKGYVYDVIDPDIIMTTGTKANEQDLFAQEYQRVSEAIVKDPNDPDKAPIYLYTARYGVRNNLQSGAMVLNSNTKRGTTAPGLDGRFRMRKYEKFTNDWNSPMRDFDPSKGGPANNYAIPVLADNGMVKDYRYMMSEVTKDRALGRLPHYDLALSRMAGQLVDKEGTAGFNEQVVDAIKDMYDTEKLIRSSNLVYVGLNSDNPELQGAYRMLPAATREYVRNTFGEDGMWVASDAVDLIFGQRKVSLTQSIFKPSDERKFRHRVVHDVARVLFGDKAAHRTRDIGRLIEGMAGYARQNIVVRTAAVTVDNHMSNNNYLLARGVNPADIMKYNNEAFRGVLAYQKDAREEVRLERELRMEEGKPNPSKTRVQDLTIKLRRTKHNLAINPVIEFVDAGALQSLVEDLDTASGKDPFPGLIKKYTEETLDRLPGGFRNVGKVATMAEDTQLYRLMNNAVQLTDFLSRYALHKHYTEKEGIDHALSVRKVMDEFINFNIPTHRYVDWANRKGLAWFTRYFLRVQKQIMNSTKDKPLQAFLAYTMANGLGMTNITESIPILQKDMVQMLGNPLTQALESHSNILTVAVAGSVLD